MKKTALLKSIAVPSTHQLFGKDKKDISSKGADNVIRGDYEVTLSDSVGVRGNGGDAARDKVAGDRGN